VVAVFRSCYVWSAGLRSRQSVEALEASGFIPVAQIIWVKDRFALGRGDYHFQHEPCWYAVRHGKNHQWNGDRSQTTAWAIPARDDAGHGHGTQKPVECMKRPIENNSAPGDAVYDPFVGSGTTIIAAEMMGRACYAIEIDPAYVDVAVTRWENFTGQKAERRTRGESYQSSEAPADARAAQAG
jgi:DNA modification methylase